MSCRITCACQCQQTQCGCLSRPKPFTPNRPTSGRPVHLPEPSQPEAPRPPLPKRSTTP